MLIEQSIELVELGYAEIIRFHICKLKYNNFSHSKLGG